MKILIKCFIETLKSYHKLQDLSISFAFNILLSFIPILLIALSIFFWFLGKQEGLDQQIISVAAQILPPSLVELIETSLFKLISQGFGAGFIGFILLFLCLINSSSNILKNTNILYMEILKVNNKISLIKSIGLFIIYPILILFVIYDFLLGISRIIPKKIFSQLEENNNFFNNQLSDILIIHVFLPVIIISLIVLTSKLFLLNANHINYWKGLIPGSIFCGISLEILNLIISKILLSLGTRFQIYGFLGGLLMLILYIKLIGFIYYFSHLLSYNILSINKIMKT